MANFRELTKQEKKQFRIFEQGYVEGLKSVTPAAKLAFAKGGDANSIRPDSVNIMDAFKSCFIIFRRSKANYVEFHDGFIAGYFRALSSELPRAFLDPEINEDVKEYLQNTWLKKKVYPEEEK